MSQNPQFAVGKISWVDLTVPDADRVREFYSAVVGWKAEPVEMEGYNDYNMIPPGGEKPAAGICFARGVNEGIPPHWMIYVTVEKMETSLRRCLELGGETVHGPRELGSYGKICVIRDPAGAVLALWEQKRDAAQAS